MCPQTKRIMKATSTLSVSPTLCPSRCAGLGARCACNIKGIENTVEEDNLAFTSPLRPSPLPPSESRRP
jgi:hypothetical protein